MEVPLNGVPPWPLQMIEVWCVAFFWSLDSCQDRMIEMGLVEWAVHVLGSPTDEADSKNRSLRVHFYRVIFM